jgi:hypothetical protein
MYGVQLLENLDGPNELQFHSKATVRFYELLVTVIPDEAEAQTRAEFIFLLQSLGWSVKRARAESAAVMAALKAMEAAAAGSEASQELELSGGDREQLLQAVEAGVMARKELAVYSEAAKHLMDFIEARLPELVRRIDEGTEYYINRAIEIAVRDQQRLEDGPAMRL